MKSLLFKNYFNLVKKKFLKIKEKYPVFLYPVLSGLLLSLSYNYNALWFFSLFSLIPFIHFLYIVKNKREFLLGALIFGLIFFGGVVIWLWKFDLFAWSGISSFWMTKIVIFWYWIFFVLVVCAPPLLIFSFIFFKFKNKTSQDILFFSGLWVLMEYSRSIFYSIVYVGENSLFGPHNTAGFLGYVLASNYNLLQLAQFGGVYLLSFIVVLVNFLVYWIFIKNKKEVSLKFKFLFLISLIIILFFPLKFIFNKKTGESIKVSAVETNNITPHEPTEDYFVKKINEHRDILNKINEKSFSPDIIVFPEVTNLNLLLLKTEMIEKYYDNIFQDDKMIIDTGSQSQENKKIKASIFYYNMTNNEIYQYDKRLLTPGAEYFPHSFSFILRTIGERNWLENFKGGRYIEGDDAVLANFRDKKIGGVTCFEIFSPEISREIVLGGANVLVNPMSHASFDGTKSIYNQTINMTKVRAVENNRYFIQAGNYAKSSIISNRGEVLINSKKPPSVLNGKIYFKENLSFYSRFGNWFVGCSFIIISLMLFLKSRNSD